jgi:hypothetical protein
MTRGPNAFYRHGVIAWEGTPCVDIQRSTFPMRNVVVRQAVAWSAVLVCLLGIEVPRALADPETDARRFQIEFETGALWQGRN